MTTSIVSPNSIPALIGAFLGGKEEDLPAKMAYTGHYIAKRTGAEESPCLDGEKRTEEVQKEIDAQFRAVASRSKSVWGRYNGAMRYLPCGIDEAELFREIIDSAKGQKEYYILDIGSGNFEWGRWLAVHLNEQDDLQLNCIFHIISIRGEKNTRNEQWINGRCKMYEFGDFPIENLIPELKKRELDLEGKIDLAGTRWCLPHLVDPVKTFAQIYNLLRPERGFFFGDGFYFFTNEQEQFNFDTPFSLGMRKSNMLRLLVDLQTPVVFSATTDKIDQFILRRRDDQPCALQNMEFMRMEPRKKYDRSFHVLGAETVCRYKRRTHDLDNLVTVKYPPLNCLAGSESLHAWLKARQLLLKSQKWKSLLHPVDTHFSRLGTVKFRIGGCLPVDSKKMKDRAVTEYSE